MNLIDDKRTKVYHAPYPHQSGKKNYSKTKCAERQMQELRIG